MHIGLFVVTCLALAMSIGGCLLRRWVDVADLRDPRNYREFYYVMTTSLVFLVQAALQIHTDCHLGFIILSYVCAGIWFINGVMRNPWKNIWSLY